MGASASLWSALAAAAALLLDAAAAQTSSACNPLNDPSCPPDPALGMTINVDFRNGAVNSFAAQGEPSYGADGVSFIVAAGGQAPQLNSLFYIMFGRVEVTMRAAPGVGIVSSLILESDDLDEIDFEWLGGKPSQLQSNYFGKGRTGNYDRGAFHDVGDTQARWVKYSVEWTKDCISWRVGDKTVRSLDASAAEPGQYPQTPTRVKFGAWAAGDPSFNQPGTVDWAGRGLDYSKGPFTMRVQSIVVADYSTGSEYSYGDRSGSWQSIRAAAGAVNAKAPRDSRCQPIAAVPGAGAAATDRGHGFVPVGGIGRDGSASALTRTGWPWVAGASPTGASTIPSGWHMTPEGKIMRDADGAAGPGGPQSVRAASLLAALLVVGVLAFLRRLC